MKPTSSRYDYDKHTAAVAHLTPAQLSAYRRAKYARTKARKMMAAQYAASPLGSQAEAPNAVKIGQSIHDANGWLFTFVFTMAGPLVLMGWLIWIGSPLSALVMFLFFIPSWEDWFAPRTK